MARFALLALVLPILAGMVSAAPVPVGNGLVLRKTSSKNATSTASSAASKATAKAAAAAANTTAVANSTSTATAAAGSFKLQDYADFQISDGTGGNAQAQANAVFVDPFQGQDLSTIDDTTAANIETMRQAAESAETDQFDPQIDAASGAAADALSVGKIKNKVLKLTGEVQGLNIKIAKAKAAGSDTSSLESQLAAENTKLTTNIATDVKNNGAASKGVA